MGCSRGKASPDTHTKLRLFADSAGYCQNPSCNVNLFMTIGESEFHIAEMAHIISANNSGPRAQENLPVEARGDYANLILLCPTCHTVIDKAEDEFPEDKISSWKREHNHRILVEFSKKYQDRSEASTHITPLLNENRTIFEVYGPLTDNRFNPESSMPKLWISKIHEIILPNNRRILKILDTNYSLMTVEETATAELFRQHVKDFETKHLSNFAINGIQFPIKLNNIFH